MILFSDFGQRSRKIAVRASFCVHWHRRRSPRMRRILGFPLRRHVIRSSSTTPRTSSRLVGDTGQAHSRATVTVGWSFRDVVVTSASSLISFSRFLFAQPAKMVWITVDDQVYRLVGPIATDLCDLQ